MLTKLVSKCKKTSQHEVIKMLPSSSPGQHDGPEAAAHKDIPPSANAKAVPIIQVAVIEINVPQEHDTLTGRLSGVYAALLMPRYVGSLEVQIAGDEQELLRGMKQMVQAIDFVHSKSYVHMDVKVSFQEFDFLLCVLPCSSLVLVSPMVPACLLVCSFHLACWYGRVLQADNICIDFDGSWCSGMLAQQC